MKPKTACYVAVLVGLLALCGPAKTSAAASGPDGAPGGFMLSYDVYRGGLRVLQFDVDVGLDEAAYRTRVALHTTGILGLLFDWKFESLSQGQRTAGGVSPARYRTYSASGSRQRTVEIVWRDGAAATVVAEPPYDEEVQRAVHPAQRIGVLDPMSALTAVMLRVGTRGCRQTAAVFDGRRRYDAALQPLGERRIDASAYARFAGVARGCRLAIAPVAGFDAGGSHLTEIGAEVWLADIGTDQGPVPVRVRIDTPWGWGFAHLAHARDAAGRLVFGESDE